MSLYLRDSTARSGRAHRRQVAAMQQTLRALDAAPWRWNVPASWPLRRQRAYLARELLMRVCSTSPPGPDLIRAARVDPSRAHTSMPHLRLTPRETWRLILAARRWARARAVLQK